MTSAENKGDITTMRYAIGIDLGGTNIAAGIVTEDYKLLEKGSVPTKAQRPWQEVAADMARLAMELVEKAGLSRADCAGIGAARASATATQARSSIPTTCIGTTCPFAPP